MRFLIEKSVLSDDQELNFQSMSREKKVKFISKYLKNHPNIDNLKYALEVCKESILEKGFDTDKNKFLFFMNKTKYPLKLETANVINHCLNNGDIKVTDRWLYRKDLYDGSDADTSFKIKAMIYASNSSLQKNADRKITPQDLLNKNGKIMEVGKIKKLLDSITVTKSTEDRGKETTGADILKQKLKTDQLDYEAVREYVKKILPNPDSSLTAMQKSELIDTGNLDDEIEEILQKKLSSVMGRDLVSILNKQFINAVTDATNKSLEGKK